MEYCNGCGGKGECISLNPVDCTAVPMPTSSKVLAQCGPTGWIVECEFEGQKFPWALYMQSGYAASILVAVNTPSGRYYVLVKQWRPGDSIACWELPAGNIGLGDPTSLIKRALKEVMEEVGDVRITRAIIGNGVAHDVGREIAGVVVDGEVKTAGFKLFVPLVLEVEAADPKTHDEGDEHTVSHVLSEIEVMDMVRNRRIYDVISLTFLRDGISLLNGGSDPFDSGYDWTMIPLEQIEQIMDDLRNPE